MAEAKRPPSALFFAGVISNPAESPHAIRTMLTEAWGEIETESPPWPFDFTDYYENEMGKGLVRRFFAWREPRILDGLHRAKIESNEMERTFAKGCLSGVSRPLNIDPGYILPSKLVLFTTKDFSHRIYIADGIFAEVTLQWRAGGFQALPWTFPDYRSERYIEFLSGLRRACALRLHPRGKAQPPSA